MFKKAIKQSANLRMAIQGPAGAGKTYSALTIATNMADNQPVALIDTEHGSASKYADLFSFDVLEMESPFEPDKYVEAIREAGKAGYAVLVIDSLSHAWKGEGGLLEMVSAIAKKKYGGNTYAAWNDATPIQKRLVEAILTSPMHVIATMRSKMDYAQEKDERTGKTVIRRLGMAPEQRDDMPYEMDIVLDMNNENEANVIKTRCSALNGKLIPKPGKQVSDILVKWLSGNPPVEQLAQPPAQRPPVVATPPPPSNGNGHAPTPDVEKIIAAWTSPKDAMTWATDNKLTENEHSARTRWAEIVKHNFEGTCNAGNLKDIMRAYALHYVTKQAQPA